MDDLKQREQEHVTNAMRINAGRKPKFGDLMRNPWASERNPQRDGYFVRKRYQGGRFNSGQYYEFTDKNGKFWETEAKYAFFIEEAVPQANAEQDAQDKIDAERYRSWRLAVITGDEEMVDRVADALPNSEDEYPTAEQWDAAVDAAIRAASKTTPSSGEEE